MRQAFIDLTAAADQIEVARSNVDLAEDTLRQARDRLADGVADTVEVVQAQQTVTQAHDDYIGAVFAHDLAKASLARAMGDAEHNVQQLLVREEVCRSYAIGNSKTKLLSRRRELCSRNRKLCAPTSNASRKQKQELLAELEREEDKQVKDGSGAKQREGGDSQPQDRTGTQENKPGAAPAKKGN